MIVNGQFVKRDGKATDAMPGVPIRYPVEEKRALRPGQHEAMAEELLDRQQPAEAERKAPTTQ